MSRPDPTTSDGGACLHARVRRAGRVLPEYENAGAGRIYDLPAPARPRWLAWLMARLSGASSAKHGRDKGA